MSITVSPLGNNSAAIAYSPGTDPQEIAAAITGYAVLHGWEMYDEEYNVIRALCADGITYKYVQVLISGAYVRTHVYSDWDAVAHTGTNLAYLCDQNSYTQQHTATSGGYMFVFVTARWLVLQSRLNTETLGSSSYNAWSGCLEFSQDTSNPMIPPFAFANGACFVGSIVHSSYHSRCYSVPSTEEGHTGQAASYASSVSTIFGASTYNRTLASVLPNTVNPIGAPGENFVFTPYAIRNSFNPEWSAVRGRFFGIKILARELGMFMDKVSIDVDNQQFYSRDGVPSDHFILTTSYYNCRFAIPA